MRRALLLLAIVASIPIAGAIRPIPPIPQPDTPTFYVVTGGGFGGGGILVENGETYFPFFGETSIAVAVDDLREESVFVRLCHEWTYDDGSHPDVWCVEACDGLVDALTFPPRTDMTYRLIVDLRFSGPDCARPTAGELVVEFA